MDYRTERAYKMLEIATEQARKEQTDNAQDKEFVYTMTALKILKEQGII